MSAMKGVSRPSHKGIPPSPVNTCIARRPLHVAPRCCTFCQQVSCSRPVQSALHSSVATHSVCFKLSCLLQRTPPNFLPSAPTPPTHLLPCTVRWCPGACLPASNPLPSTHPIQPNAFAHSSPPPHPPTKNTLTCCCALCACALGHARQPHGQAALCCAAQQRGIVHCSDSSSSSSNSQFSASHPKCLLCQCGGLDS
jgi:hypothetical protein